MSESSRFCMNIVLNICQQTCNFQQKKVATELRYSCNCFLASLFARQSSLFDWTIINCHSFAKSKICSLLANEMICDGG